MTFHIFRGFEQLSSSTGWQVMVVQSDTKKWLTKDFKVWIYRTLALNMLKQDQGSYVCCLDQSGFWN